MGNGKFPIPGFVTVGRDSMVSSCWTQGLCVRSHLVERNGEQNPPWGRLDPSGALDGAEKALETAELVTVQEISCLHKHNVL